MLLPKDFSGVQVISDSTLGMSKQPSALTCAIAMPPGNFLDVVVGSQGGTIEGAVIDAKGKPVEEATVLGAPNGERRKRFDVFGRATTDAQGHSRLRGLVPGDYTLFAWEDPDENLQDPEILKANESRGEEVQVEEGANKSITLKVISVDDGP